MTTKDKQNPKVEWGFFAVTPRLVRTQYKQLSHTEKWLYVCLKDLCGDKGMCYRTLRVLSQETDLSLGNLSVGIRHLHEAGLIHAEKKRRMNNPTAKEVWHITIVDIWQSNVEYCSKYEHSDENVQDVNNNVQNTNNPPLECSNPEQQCSNFDDRRKNIEEQHIEEITEKDTYVNANALTRTHSSQETSSDNESHYQQDIPSVDNAQASEQFHIVDDTNNAPVATVATRNTDSLPEVTQAAAAPNKRRGSRKPKIKTPEDENMDQRVKNVFECLDTLASEYAGEEFHYPPYKTDKEAVKTLLTSWKGLTPKQVSEVYRFMMDSPRSKSGFLWSEHMSVKAFCNNFAAEYAKMIGKGTSNGQANKETKAPSAAVAAGYTDYTNTPPTNYKPLPRKRA